MPSTATTPRQHDRHTELWDKWMELWNGRRERADEILAPGFVLHLPQYGMPDPATLRTSEQFVAWIDAFRSSYENARIRTDLGPFADGDHVIGRWIFQGSWQHGRPAGVTAAPGTPVTLRGADILRLDDTGRIAEYWLSDDLLDVYVGLGAPLPSP
ncbi:MULTISPECIES: ester cyclase [Streptomyces]|uniref:Ester cyclase n=1 Tax=Streptomyces sp. R33 TaxID=3238629 RepID=A0AB39YIL2_9ACTN|nr:MULTISPECIES: nuclear transport factor 2 family protein [Streptomyces]THA29724.1 hypothetical protein E6W17_39020 [Streptomyces sp. A1547]WSN54220.1 nuclear transport factor 2 family protein [Streptomyces sp. NBC_01296]